MIRFGVRSINILYRESWQDPEKEALLLGDVFEITEPPTYEVDPETRQNTDRLKCFKVTNDDGALALVERGSWETS